MSKQYAKECTLATYNSSEIFPYNYNLRIYLEQDYILLIRAYYMCAMNF